MESTLRRRSGRTASAISTGSASQQPAALGVDVGLPFSLDGPAGASLASWSHPASDLSATLAASQTSSYASSSPLRDWRMSRIEAQVAPARVADGTRSPLASTHASSTSSAISSSSSIPRPLASMPVPRRRFQTTPTSSSAAAPASTPSRERTASQPVAGQSVPRLELSPHSLASFKRSFRDIGEAVTGSSGPIASSSSTVRLSSSPSDSATSSSSPLDFAFLESSDMGASSSGTSPEAETPDASSSQSLPTPTSLPSGLPFDGLLFGGDHFGIPQHSPPTPGLHARVKRRRSGSRPSGIPRPPSSLPRLIGRNRRNNVTSAPEILERNAQADISSGSGEDARFLDTPAPEATLQTAHGARSSAVHPSISARVDLLSRTIRRPLSYEMGTGAIDATSSARSLPEEMPNHAESSGISASPRSEPQTGLIHRRPRRMAHSRTSESLASLSPLPLPPRESLQWQSLPQISPLPALRASSPDNATIAPASPISVRSRRGNALPLELGELPSFDTIDWDQTRFDEGARLDTQSTNRRTTSQLQRPNLHRNATAVTPPEESPLTTPDGDVSATSPPEAYRTFFRSDRDGDIIMEGQYEEEGIASPGARADVSRGDGVSVNSEHEVLGDNDYDGFSDDGSVASSSSWLRTIVGEGEVALNAGEWPSVSLTSAEDQYQPSASSVYTATAYGSVGRDAVDSPVPTQSAARPNESAAWNLASEFLRAQRLSQLIERRRSIASEVESHQARHDTSTQEPLDRLDGYSEDTRVRLRSLRAQINRDRDAFLEPFEWQMTSDDEEVTSATSRQANVSAGGRPRARLWGEIQTEQPLSRNPLTSPVGLPRPSLSVSTATTSGLRSSGQAALRRRPGSLGSGSMRGPTRSSNEAWLRNQGIDLHESLSLPSLQRSSTTQPVSAEEEHNEDASFGSLSGREGTSSSWSQRSTSSAARALRRIAARLPADTAASEERQGNGVTAADLLRQFRGTEDGEDQASLPANRTLRPLRARRSAFSQVDTGSLLNIDLPSISPLSNLLPLPSLDAASTHSATSAGMADGATLNNTSSAMDALAGGDSLPGSAGFWPTASDTNPDNNPEAHGVPGRFRSWGPANLSSMPTRPPSPPAYEAPVSQFARSRLLDRLREQSSRVSSQTGSWDFPRTSYGGPNVIQRPADSHSSRQNPEQASHPHASSNSSEPAHPQGNLGQVRRSLDTIRRILDDLETPRSRNNGSVDPSSSHTSTLLSPPERTTPSNVALPDLPRPSRISAPSHAGNRWQPGTRNPPIPPLPELPLLDSTDLNPTARAPRPRRPMLQPFDEIYAEVEAEFAGRDRVRERLPRRRSAFMQDILAELDQRRSAPSAQAVPSPASRNLGTSHSSTETASMHNRTSANEDHLQQRRASRDRLLERLSTFARNQTPLPPRTSGAPSEWVEPSTESSFARRWDSLLSEDEEDRVPLPPFMWRSLRTSTTLGGIASEVANYVSDSELDTSYEGLLALSDRIGSARPRGATATALREGLERSTFQATLSSDVIAVGAVDREVRCGICLEDYSEGDVLGKSKKCGHALHSICFETWLKRVDTCPICRQSAV